MAAEHDGAIFGKRIDHQQLVVNDGADTAFGRQLLGAEIPEQLAIVNPGGPYDRYIAFDKGVGDWSSTSSSGLSGSFLSRGW